ncbi:hypothetical protein Gohar_013791 [Gossypium harknessii]|uniref:Uncharacterized protein n=1 Tax=Gossypium harknessii TaxID=34285 RepID=A0A7J9H1W8_9ROSI|nr:hypothetical protein [Gossypium harknessii]
MALYKKAGVPMTSTEQLLKPSRNIIEDTLLTQDVGENSHLKLDWMIQWMQESGLIFEEFASEEEGENKEDDGSEEIDFKKGD